MVKRIITLIDPCVDLEDSYHDFIEDFNSQNERIVPFVLRFKEDLPSIVQKLKDASKGIGLPNGYVPHSTFWLVEDNVHLLGVSNFRHKLNKDIEIVGGHIGYSVRPSERNKGYATLLLAMTLDKAKEIGLGRVLVTCSKSNIASERVIQKNGGIFESEVQSDDGSLITRRYWITLRDKDKKKHHGR